MLNSAVFLDRDGVIIHTNVVEGKPYAIRSTDELKIFPEAQNAVRRLKNSGYKIIVVTNQPDIENGLVASEVVEKMHRILSEALPIDAIYCCPHNKERKCSCRKPEIGMFLQAKEEFDIDLTASWMVGDRASDIVAGGRAGCKTVFIARNYSELPPSTQDATVNSLAEAAEFILI